MATCHDQEPEPATSYLLLIAAGVGGSCLVLQAVLTLLFAKLLPSGPWTLQPAFAACAPHCHCPPALSQDTDQPDQARLNSLHVCVSVCLSVWSRRHQVIVLPLMVAVSVLGCLAWWAPNGAHATPHDRIYAPNAAGERLAAVLLGELVLWP